MSGRCQTNLGDAPGEMRLRPSWRREVGERGMVQDGSEEVRERLKGIARGSGIFLSGEWGIGDLMGRYCRILRGCWPRGGKFDVRKMDRCIQSLQTS